MKEQQQFRKMSEIVKLPVVEMTTGKTEGCVRQIIVNPGMKDIYLTLENGQFDDTYLLSSQDIVGIGEDYILVRNEEAICELKKHEELTRKIDSFFPILQLDAISIVGNALGKIVDFELNEKDGEFLNICLEDGRVFDGRQIVSICREYVFVDLDGVGDMAKQTKRIEKTITDEKKMNHEISRSGNRSMDMFLKEDAKSYAAGMKLTQDVRSKDGTFFVKKGTVLTDALIREAEEHNALVDIAMYAE